jgi:hypothetical protein
MSQARLHTLTTLKDVKTSMLEFVDAVHVALASVDADIIRVSQWLNHERPAHWKAEVRRREDELGRAKMEVERKRLIAAPEPASLALEQRAVDRAKQRLEHAQRKLANVKRWAPVWDRQAMMYKSSCQGLSDSLHSAIPDATKRLERMMRSLEEYTRLAVPTSELSPTDLPAEPPPAPPGE